MRIEDLLRDLNIPHVTEGHHHVTKNWLNIHCPFCEGEKNYHMGIAIEGGQCHCWRCGAHRLIETLSKLSGLPPAQVGTLIKQYGGKSRIKTTEATPVRMKAFKFPSGSGMLLPAHRRYLERRNFNPDEIVQTWGLLGTGPISLLDGSDYKHRILAPIYWNGKIVSFQGRAISEGVEPKYKACPKDRELTHHQHILYGHQEKWGDVGICVEGITDVWRLGEQAFGVFGISFTTAQVRAIAKHFRHVAVIFDDDPQAVKQADRLVAELKMHNVNAWRVDIEGDPGGMKQEDANNLVKEILQ